jgi:coenzyme F420-0:L-glutamate ligase
LEILPISLPLKKRKFDIFYTICLSGFEFLERDIIVISSKYLSISEGSIVKLKNVKVSKRARNIASRYHLSPQITELVLRESNYVFPGVPGFLLTVRQGIIAPNAGIDKSNVPSGFVALYPRRPFESAEYLRRKFFNRFGINTGIVIADSRIMPMRIGTVGVAIANAGFEPVKDERGKKDLFGRTLKVTFKAIADSIATMGVAVMGEANESTPVAVVRGMETISTTRSLSWRDLAIEPKDDIYRRGFLGLKC